jgi:uncharacterized repeat protein (TIGR01451 family)
MWSGGLAQTLPLDYGPYRNYADGLTPLPSAEIALWSDQGQAIALTHAGPDWRTAFWAVPFEALAPSAQAPAMASVVAWLSDLGDSTFVADKRVAAPGDLISFRLELGNIGPEANQVAITGSLPAQLELVTATLSGASYDPHSRQITWRGSLAPGGDHAVTYLARVVGQATAGPVVTPMSLHYSGHNLTLNREVTTWVSSPDLSPSALTTDMSGWLPDRPVTATLALVNDGRRTQPGYPVSATLFLPQAIPAEAIATYADRGHLSWQGNRLMWQGAMPSDSVVTITAVFTPTEATYAPPPLFAAIEDGVSGLLVRESLVVGSAARVYLPFVAGGP